MTLLLILGWLLCGVISWIFLVKDQETIDGMDLGLVLVGLVIGPFALTWVVFGWFESFGKMKNPFYNDKKGKQS